MLESGKAPCSIVVGFDNGEIRDSAVGVKVEDARDPVCRIVGACVDVCRDYVGARPCPAWARPEPSDAMLSMPIESLEEGTVVFMTAETTWFVVGPLAFAGQNDGVAAESVRRCSLGITPSRKLETCLILPIPL